MKRIIGIVLVLVFVIGMFGCASLIGGSATISLTADCKSSYDEADELLIHDERNITISTLALIGDPESTGVSGKIRGGNCSKNGGGKYHERLREKQYGS